MKRRLFAAAFAAFALLAPAAHAAKVDLKPGDAAPNFLGETVGGDEMLVNQHAGKVLVISFWATWCRYCLKEMPVLAGIETASKGKVDVVAFNTEDRDTFRRVTRLLKDVKLQLSYDPDEAAQNAYGVSGLPHMVIIGRDGKIVAIHHGYGEGSLDGIVADINRAAAAAP
jgi:thiol-disulfide isomerase/thioredoxin